MTPIPETSASCEYPGDGQITHDTPRSVNSATQAAGLLGAAVSARATAIEGAYGHGPIGVMLSGGVDSAVVLAELSRRDLTLESMTLEFEGSDGDETQRALLVAKQFGARHTVVRVSLEELESLSIRAIELLGVTELWEISAAVAILATGDYFHTLLSAGRPILTGGGADVILAGGEPRPASSMVLGDIIDNAIQSNFTHNRLVPDFYERLWGGRSSQLIQFFQTFAMVEATRSFGLSALFENTSDTSKTVHDKLALRLLATDLGVPQRVTWAGKDPMQTSAGIIQGFSLLARRLVTELPNSSTYRNPETESLEHTLSRAGIALLANRHTLGAGRSSDD